MVKHFRLDDRLVHGQIVTAWVNSTNCDTIMVADDAASTNALSKTLFSMAVPKSIKLLVLSVDDACDYLKKDNTANTLLIVGSLQSASRMCAKLDSLKSLNIGNISMNSKRRKYSKSVWMDEEEIATAKGMLESGIELYVQVVPTEKKYEFKDII